MQKNPGETLSQTTDEAAILRDSGYSFTRNSICSFILMILAKNEFKSRMNWINM